MNASIVLDESQSINIEFDAQYIIALNPTGSPIYLRRGGNDIPRAASADIYVPPTTFVAIPITATRNFGAALGTAVVPAQSGAPAILLFYDTPQLFGIASVALPNVTAQSLWKQAGSTLSHASYFAVATPPANKALNIHKIFFWTSPLDSATTSIIFQLASGTQLFQYSPAATDYAGRIQVLDFMPDGITLPVGQELRVYNYDVSASPIVYTLCQYSLVG
jgi:hypothetical protein